MNQETSLSAEPIYNIRSVAEKTGLSPETMRAWERRYGFPNPYRNPKGYRLYTGDEIAALIWLKNQTEVGMTIGQAVKLLEELRFRGRDPVVAQTYGSASFSGVLRSPEEYVTELVVTLLAIEAEQATQLLRNAFEQHPMETVLLEIITPTLVNLGEKWHVGEIPIAIEHFSTQLIRTQLLQALDRLPAPSKKVRIITACAPGEWHEVGILILTILLREQGWAVTYLGANLGLERFSEMIAHLKPHLILFSATSPLTAEGLEGMMKVLEEIPEPKPLIGLGGQAFLDNPALTNHIPGTFFGPGADDAVYQINQLISRISGAE
jgi:methanogenic corrinoid protein MtbC1